MSKEQYPDPSIDIPEWDGICKLTGQPKYEPEADASAEFVKDLAHTTNPKDLIGVTKPSLQAIPWVAIYEMGKAMLDGMKKYGLFNWRDHAVRSDIYVDAAMRHITAWSDGQAVAEDSNIHHLAHAMACLSILIDAEYAGKLIDNRDKSQLTSRYLKENTE